MRYEVIEQAGDWIVQQDGQEIARFAEQAQALNDVSRRLGQAQVGEAGASLMMRFEPRPPRSAA